MDSLPSESQTKSIIPFSKEDEACLHAMQFVNTQMVSVVVSAAIELEIFEVISRAGPGAKLSSFEIAAQLPTNTSVVPLKLDIMLRLLVTQSLLNCSLRSLEDGSTERVYGLAPAAKYLLRGEGGSLVPMITLPNHPVIWKAWSHMKDAITEGDDLFTRVHGMQFYQYLDTDPALNKVFSDGMAGISTIAMTKILEIYRGFDGLTSLVDVGGGNGRLLSMIISTHPSIKGVNFDMPRVLENAPSYHGIDHVGGDMFTKIPAGDAILMKDILHNWSDEHCLKILKNCHEVLPKNGKVIVITQLPTEVPGSSMSSRYVAGIDFVMMLKFSGKERSAKELEALGKKSGFSKFEVACSSYGIWAVLEFYK